MNNTTYEHDGSAVCEKQCPQETRDMGEYAKLLVNKIRTSELSPWRHYEGLSEALSHITITPSTPGSRARMSICDVDSQILLYGLEQTAEQAKNGTATRVYDNSSKEELNFPNSSLQEAISSYLDSKLKKHWKKPTLTTRGADSRI